MPGALPAFERRLEIGAADGDVDPGDVVMMPRPVATQSPGATLMRAPPTATRPAPSRITQYSSQSW